jgi:hypothetical protein
MQYVEFFGSGMQYVELERVKNPHLNDYYELITAINNYLNEVSRFGVSV